MIRIILLTIILSSCSSTPTKIVETVEVNIPVQSQVTLPELQPLPIYNLENTPESIARSYALTVQILLNHIEKLETIIKGSRNDE